MIKIGLVLGAIALSFSTAVAAPSAGDALPDFDVTAIDGTQLTDENLSDKLVVFEWTNHDCPFVKKHYKSGNMQATQEAAAAHEAVWISVVSSAPNKQGHIDVLKAADLTTSRNAKPTYIVLDESSEFGRLFGAKTTPHMYISNEGAIAYAGAIDSIPTAKVSDIDAADNYVIAALDAIAAGDDIVVKQSKPYGCNVKY